VSWGWDWPGPSLGLRGLVTGREAAFLDHRSCSVVEEVAQRPSRDVVGWGWDGSGTVLRASRLGRGRPRTSATVGCAVTTVAEVRRPLGLRLEAW